MYEKMYTTLFNAMTDALRDLERGDIAAAKTRMIKAQRDAEELYIDQETGEE